MSSKAQETGKDNCPICLEPVGQDRTNCYQCMSCKQKMHGNCEIEWNHSQKPNNRLLSDDILICPVCEGNSIAYCSDLTDDMNADIKMAVQEDQYRRGGKTKKTIKTKKTRKTKKAKKTKKTTKQNKYSVFEM
jgi:hypothetical protein